MEVSSVAQLKATVTEDQYQKAKQFLLPKMQAELPAHLHYHNKEHTLQVMEAVEYLMEKENVPEEDRWMVLTAALYHDAGFVRGNDNHEEQSCALAWETLPQFDYQNQSIERICRLIMVTKVPQLPTNLYEKIICDADLFYLGTSDFPANAYNLYKEYLALGQVRNEEEWQLKQLLFLQQHRYFTPTAIAENEPRQKAQLQQLLERQQRSNGQASQAHATLRENAHDLFYMVLGVLVAGFALKSFLVPHNFFDGGITGISLLLHEIYHYNLAVIIVLANLPLIALGFFTVSKRFGVKTLVCIVLFAICLQFVPYPTIPDGERMLLSVFGGFFLGVGIGLCMRAGCTLDGVEVLALKTFKKTPFTITEVILAINILIFCVAAFKLGPMTALYSIITYFTASKFIDYVVEGIEAYTGVTIISSQSELIKYRLVNELGRGITVYKGERGFLPGQFESSSECDIIFTVVTRLELRRLKNFVHETDPKAFVFANTIREASGGILRRRQQH